MSIKKEMIDIINCDLCHTEIDIRNDRYTKFTNKYDEESHLCEECSDLIKKGKKY